MSKWIMTLFVVALIAIGAFFFFDKVYQPAQDQKLKESWNQKIQEDLKNIPKPAPKPVPAPEPSNPATTEAQE